MAWLLLGGAVAQLAIYGAVHGSTYQLVTVNLVSSLILLAIHEIAFETTLPGAVHWALAKARRRENHEGISEQANVNNRPMLGDANH